MAHTPAYLAPPAAAAAFRALITDAVGTFQHLLQFFVLAGIQVFLEFAALALEFAVLVHQGFLAGVTLAFGQGGRFTLELVRRGLQGVAQIDQLFLAARELLLQLHLGGLGRHRLTEDAVGVHKACAELFCLRVSGCGNRSQTEGQA